MSTNILSVIISFQPGAAGYDLRISYLIGAIVALLIMGYLIYILLRPDKF
jgi:K+-transporting ATPase KdpF subunit